MQHLVNDRHVHILMWELVEYNVRTCRTKIWTCMLKFSLVKNIHTWSEFEFTQRKKKLSRELSSRSGKSVRLDFCITCLQLLCSCTYQSTHLWIFFFCDRCVNISTSANFQVTSTDFLFCKFSHRILQALTFCTIFTCMLTFQSLSDGVNKMRTEQGKAMLLWCKTTMKTSRWGHQGSSSTQNSPGLEHHLMVW